MKRKEVPSPFEVRISEILKKIDDPFLKEQLEFSVRDLKAEKKKKNRLLTSIPAYTEDQIAERVQQRVNIISPCLEYLKKSEAYAELDEVAQELVKHYICVISESTKVTLSDEYKNIDEVIKIIKGIEITAQAKIKKYLSDASGVIQSLSAGIEQPFDSQVDFIQLGGTRAKLVMTPANVLAEINQEDTHINNNFLDALLISIKSFIEKYLEEIDKNEEKSSVFSLLKKMLYLEKVSHHIIVTLKSRFDENQVIAYDTLRLMDLQDVYERLDGELGQFLKKFTTNLFLQMVKEAIPVYGPVQRLPEFLQDPIKEYIQYLAQQEIGKKGKLASLEEVIKTIDNLPFITALMQAVKNKSGSNAIIREIRDGVMTGQYVDFNKRTAVVAEKVDVNNTIENRSNMPAVPIAILVAIALLFMISTQSEVLAQENLSDFYEWTDKNIEYILNILNISQETQLPDSVVSEIS